MLPVIFTGPVLTPAETVATICVSLQLTTETEDPLKRIEFEPWLERKPDPLTVTCVPTTPLVGAMDTIFGSGTVKFRFVLLNWLPSATHTRPLIALAGTVAVIEVSDQVTIAAFTPLKLKLLAPCVDPKPLPGT